MLHTPKTHWGSETCRDGTSDFECAKAMSFTSCTRNAAGEQARLIAFGPAWLRSALCLLGKWLYRAQGSYAEAEPLYQRALEIDEKALGPEHPDVATSLENYASLLRETGRADEAAEMETRAQSIRAKFE